jgi:hypothetical protein
MPVSIDTRPPGINHSFRPGNAAELTLVFPSGSLTGRTFTSSLNGTTLSAANGSLTILGDTMTIAASAALTTSLGSGLFAWLLTETTGGESERLFTGTWTGSTRPNDMSARTIDVLDGDVTVNVTGGPSAFHPDLVMDTPTFPGDGTVEGGVIRRTQSVHVPWDYTQTTNPTDRAIGTAVDVDVHVDIDDDQGGLFGPDFSTGSFGPRAIFNAEGLVRYGVNQNTLSLWPITFGDLLGVANDDGANRTITPAWSFMSARQLISQNGDMTL